MDYPLIIVGSRKSRFKISEFKFSGTNRDVVPKQRYNRLPSVGEQIHATPTFEHGWVAPGHTVIGVS